MKLQFFHVADLCRFIEILLIQLPENHIFNVGNTQPITIKEWVTLCYHAVGKTPGLVMVDKTVGQRNYFCFHDYEYVLDISLLSATYPLEKGLQEEFNWYKNNHDSIDYRRNYTEFIDEQLANIHRKHKGM